MCNQIKRLICLSRFWIRFTIFLLLTVLFLGLGGLFIRLSQQYTLDQHNTYKSVYVSVDNYLVINVECGCYCYYQNPKYPDCPCKSYPYTGVIDVSYVVNNDTYFDEKRVLCGNTYNDAIDKLKTRYPKDEKVHMYYNDRDPGAGVLFYVDYVGSYWAGTLLCFICGLVTFTILLGSFCI